MLNHIVIMGRLTRDPELRRTGSGIAVASFSVAVDRDFGGRDGGEKETDFIDCVAWRQTGEFVSKYFTKGSMIVVSGRLQIRSWTDKEGRPAPDPQLDRQGRQQAPFRRSCRGQRLFRRKQARQRGSFQL